MKKIYILTSNISEIGGVQRITINLANQLSNKYNVTIINCGKDTGKKYFQINSEIRLEYLGVNIKKNKNLLNIIKNMFEIFIKLKKVLIKNINENDKKILIGMGIGFSYVISFIKLKNIKKIGSQHGGYRSNIILNKIRSIILKKLDYFITINPEMYKECTENLKLVNIRLIPNFILENNYLTEKKQKELNSALAIGRFCQDKGFDYLIDIWELVVKENPKFKLKIVGNGELEEKILEMIKLKKLQNNIELLPATSNVKKYYKESDLYLLTSRREGFGMVILEAMASRLPIISFDCPTGPRLLIKNNYNGYLVECFNKKKFAEKIVFLLKNKNEYIEMSENAFIEAKQYSAKKIIKKWEKIIEE